MRNLLCSVVILVMVLGLVSCGKTPGSSEIYGKWRCAVLNRTLEFNQDGSVIMESPMMKETGTYQLKGRTLEIKWATVESPTTWKVSISGENLVIVKGKGPNATFTYERVK